MTRYKKTYSSYTYTHPCLFALCSCRTICILRHCTRMRHIYMCMSIICMLRRARHPGTHHAPHPRPKASRGGTLCGGNVYLYIKLAIFYKKIRLSYYTILPPLVQTLLSTDLRFAFLRFIIGFMGEERSH